jgi:hypothetical protein
MHGVYPTGPDDSDGMGENLNTGIEVVTRIDRVLDLVNSPGQVAMRAEMKRAHRGCGYRWYQVRIEAARLQKERRRR